MIPCIYFLQQQSKPDDIPMDRLLAYLTGDGIILLQLY